jgi:ATP-dependent RNA helicase
VFTLGSLQRVDQSIRDPQVLILSPTRELAEQTQKVCLALGNYMQVKVHCCIGGRDVNEDVRQLEHGTHVVSGTPGRVYDMIQRRTFKTNNIKMLVLDEADEMLA